MLLLTNIEIINECIKGWMQVRNVTDVETQINLIVQFHEERPLRLIHATYGYGRKIDRAPDTSESVGKGIAAVSSTTCHTVKVNVSPFTYELC